MRLFPIVITCLHPLCSEYELKDAGHVYFCKHGLQPKTIETSTFRHGLYQFYRHFLKNGVRLRSDVHVSQIGNRIWALEYDNAIFDIG